MPKTTEGELTTDYIDVQVAIRMIKHLRHKIWEVDIPSPTVPEYIEHHEQMTMLMNECDRLTTELFTMPSAQPEQRWIPCSDRYPNMDERVLVYTVAHEYHVWDCMSNRADNYFWEDEAGLYHDKYKVDLWLPLPEL